jgi:hypothetical protein
LLYLLACSSPVAIKFGTIKKNQKPKKVNKHFDHFFLMLTLKPTQLKLPSSPKIQLVVSPPVDANHHHYSRPTSAA